MTSAISTMARTPLLGHGALDMDKMLPKETHIDCIMSTKQLRGAESEDNAGKQEFR
jgi:hypothetical protein